MKPDKYCAGAIHCSTSNEFLGMANDWEGAGRGVLCCAFCYVPRRNDEQNGNPTLKKSVIRPIFEPDTSEYTARLVTKKMREMCG